MTFLEDLAIAITIIVPVALCLIVFSNRFDQNWKGDE